MDGDEVEGETERTLALAATDYLLGVHIVSVVVVDDAEEEAYSGSFSFMSHN